MKVLQGSAQPDFRTNFDVGCVFVGLARFSIEYFMIGQAGSLVKKFSKE